jgi:muconolactone delta-isomerase
MASLFLLEIDIEPHDESDKALDKIVKAIDTGLAQTKGSYLQLFQVTGEDKVLVVLDKEVQAVKNEIRRAVGKLARFKCTPIRKYENFAKMLGISDENLLAERKDLSGKGQLYWIQVRIEYRGLGNLDELHRRWKEEAEAFLRVRASGKMKAVAYKIVFEREVHLFVMFPNGDVLDQVQTALPMFKEMGDQMYPKCKGLEFIK